MNAERFTLFWNGPFSQWHRSPFTIAEIVYVTAEQYMMAEKARLFGDEATLGLILATVDPREQKALGRQVRGFDRDAWQQVARDVVYRGNRAKFTTHRDLLDLLLATEGTTLVEASPFDRIWGIGLGEEDAGARDRSAWRGMNWLGETLTRLRDELLKERRSGGISKLETCE